MTIADYVSLTITRDSVGVARAGFGVPLMLSYNAAWSGDLVRTYTALTEVDDDFATTSVEYLCAQKLFGQSPKLESIKIGKCSNKPTQRYTATIGTPVNSHVYKLTVAGESFATTDVTYTSDASATDAEIVAGLVTALNAVSGKNYTATGAASPLLITANTAGAWFSVEVSKDDIANMVISQNHADPGVAADIASIQNETDDWYFLVTNYNSKAYVAAVEAAMESVEKMYLWDANDTSCPTVAVAGADDTFEDAFDLAYTHSSGWYHPSPANFLAAATVGRCAPLDPGKVTFALKKLAGVAAVSRTATHRTNILARKANSYEQVTSDSAVTYNGTVFSGEYIDVIRDLAFVKDDIQKSIYEVLAGADKVPFTDEGIAMIEGALRGALARAEAQGIFASGWTVTVPKAASVSVANKTARTCPDIKFTATLAGAIHKAVVSGVVSV